MYIAISIREQDYANYINLHCDCSYKESFLSIAPTVAVTGFHVSVLNSTAVEVTWRPPSSIIGVNGDIRGYKILVEKVGGTQKTINVTGATSRVYHVTGLERLTTYVFSILMYTVGDGPPSVRLKVTTPNSSKLEAVLLIVFP